MRQPALLRQLICVSCGSTLAYARREHDIVPLRPDGIYVDAERWVWHPRVNRDLFGDETVDYQAALERHYAEGPPDGWEADHISSYATMHPFEDFAETFAHVMHISDTIHTARAYGLSTVDPSAFSSFRDLVTGVWVPISTALNQINRSMGAGDLFPFVLAPAVLDKLDLLAEIVRDAGRTEASSRSVTMDG